MENILNLDSHNTQMFLVPRLHIPWLWSQAFYSASSNPNYIDFQRQLLTSVFAVRSTELWHHCISRTVWPHLCWWFQVVHQCAGVRIANGCSPVGCMCQRSRPMDEVQQTEIKHLEDSANLDRNWANWPSLNSR